MSEPTQSEIERARKVAARHFNVYPDDPMPDLTQWGQDKLTDQIAQALADTRERCARIAFDVLNAEGAARLAHMVTERIREGE